MDISRDSAAPTVTAIAVANVVDVQAAQGPAERNFAISDQVTITIDGQVIGRSAGRYVPGTGTITGVESTAPTPQGVSLAGMVHIDPATGVVTYDPSQFAFLGVGNRRSTQSDSRAGRGRPSFRKR